MYEKFTDRARKVMQLANMEAQRFGHEYIGTEHVLIGLIKEGSGVAAFTLKNLDLDPAKVKAEIERLLTVNGKKPLPQNEIVLGKLPHTDRCKAVVEFAILEARELGHNHVGTEHLLLGLLRVEGGIASQVFKALDVRVEYIRDEVMAILGKGEGDPAVSSQFPPGKLPEFLLLPKGTFELHVPDELIESATRLIVDGVNSGAWLGELRKEAHNFLMAQFKKYQK